MKGKVTVELEAFVRAAVNGVDILKPFEGREPPQEYVIESRIYLRGVLSTVPLDRGGYYRRTEAKVRREIAARLPDHIRRHFPTLGEEYIAEIEREVI